MQYFAIHLSSCLGGKKFCQALLLHIVTLLLPRAVLYLLMQEILPWYTQAKNSQTVLCRNL